MGVNSRHGGGSEDGASAFPLRLTLRRGALALLPDHSDDGAASSAAAYEHRSALVGKLEIGPRLGRGLDCAISPRVRRPDALRSQPSFLAIACASSLLTSRSFARSALLPTRMIGTPSTSLTRAICARKRSTRSNVAREVIE